MHFFSFDLIRQPAAPSLLPLGAAANLLVLYLEGEGKRAFLFSILQAAGYQEPASSVYLYAVKEGSRAIDLTGLLRSLSVDRVLIFGLPLAALGWHLQLAPYVAVQVNQNWCLLADDLGLIEAEKNAGKPQKAAALWKGIKTQFLAQ